jgi:hypothetical protein
VGGDALITIYMYHLHIKQDKLVDWEGSFVGRTSLPISEDHTYVDYVNKDRQLAFICRIGHQ